uniref:Uncharacterized protein n=1 Tax=Varanus komodoensis TaxID=61221 RepID=A0A8D2IYY6_VARKO
MEGKWSSTEIGGGGDNLQNAQHKRRNDSASDSSTSRCIHQPLKNLVSNSSVSLDLSRKDLQYLTEDIYKLFNLKHLHLEGNALTVIPEDFFQHLPKLLFQMILFVEQHLLIMKLHIIPFCNVISLTALNLRHCPLEFPPPEVIQKGLPGQLWVKEHSQTERAKITCLEVYSNLFLISIEMAPVEKLNLTDFMKSSLDLSDGWPNEEEMIRFQKLRDELIQDEREEYLNNKMAANESMPLLTRTRTNERISHKSSMSLFPAASSYDLVIQSKRTEEYRLAALKDMKMKQALIEQQRKQVLLALILVLVVNTLMLCTDSKSELVLT